MIKAIVFDLYETLVTESGTRPPGVSSLAPRLGCERKAFRDRWKAIRPAVKLGHLSFRQALGDIASELGSRVNEDTLQRICAERIRAKAEPFTEIDGQVLMLIERLRSRDLRFGVISNCFAEDVTAWPQCALAAHFDCTVFSFEFGIAKPDPAIYMESIRRLGVDVSDTWFIGDGDDGELLGAEAAGLRAFKALWFLKRWPHFREESYPVETVDSPDDVIRLVDAIADLGIVDL